MTWFIDLRQLPAGGDPVLDVHSITFWDGSTQLRTAAPILDGIRGKDVLLVTHGFNVNFQDGIDSLSAWSKLLTLPAGIVVVGVLWPGDARIPVFVDYPWEDNEASRSGQLLAEYLDANFGGATSLSMASHSLGARVLLETISHLSSLSVKRLVLMAGAIDDDCLSNQYQKAIASKVGEVSVLASDGDYVLMLAFPVANPVAGILDQGHPYWRAALGRDGPQTPTPSEVQAGWQIPTKWNYGHLDYLGKSAGASPYTRPANLPLPDNAPTPDSKSAWSAAFVSNRYRRP